VQDGFHELFPDLGDHVDSDYTEHGSLGEFHDGKAHGKGKAHANPEPFLLFVSVTNAVLKEYQLQVDPYRTNGRVLKSTDHCQDD
jgi:hypothetical protein